MDGYSKDTKIYSIKQVSPSFETIKINKGFDKPGINIGGDFCSLVTESSIFIDKSLLIKHLLENNNKVSLITMPRRWGKSVNMDMIKRFLEVMVDEDANEVNDYIRRSSNNYQLFFGNEKLQKLNIAYISIKDTNYTQISSENICGTKPVIFINFKDCKGNYIEEVFEGVKLKILELYEYKFSYLIRSSKSYGIQLVQDKFKYIIQEIKKSQYESKSKIITTSIYLLSSLLFNHHNKKVFILIDEYDAPINDAFLNIDNNDSTKIMNFFSDIYSSSFKDNKFLDKGIITGVNRIARANLFSGLNNLVEYNFQSEELIEYYGLNNKEIDIMLNHFNIIDEKEKVKYLYNGYKSNNKDEGRYNIWSVVNFLNRTQAGSISNAYRNYWLDSGSNLDSVGIIFKTNENLKKKIIQIMKREYNSVF